LEKRDGDKHLAHLESILLAGQPRVVQQILERMLE